MKERTTRTLLQTVALVGAMATGATAFGDYWKEWSATGKGYWDVDSNWTTGSGTTLDDYRVGATGAEIAFDKAITDDTANLYVFAGSTTFSADDSAYGLTKNNWLCVGVWFGGEASTTFASGTYSFSEINIGRWTASGTDEVTGETVTWPCNGSLTITGGATVSAPNIWVGNTGIDGTLTLNGGTLSAGYVGGTGTLAVGENGGTFDNAEAATIATAITGTGTLTKTGAGTLTITGDTSGFTGTITVAEGAGSVTVAGTTIEAGQTVSFYSTCRWIGTGGDNYWSTPGNWSTRNVPGENDAVEFTVAAM
ncbi:MAG: hypothetical protein J6P13_06490 [Kiritimatiellae bacterium]|nr:hypothetical protein [Kiritimatiellia bacterium]